MKTVNVSILLSCLILSSLARADETSATTTMNINRGNLAVYTSFLDLYEQTGDAAGNGLYLNFGIRSEYFFGRFKIFD